MTDARIHGAKKNIVVSIGCQLVTLLCGLIVPKLMIDAFGSEAYGATVSIGQFLSYIALLEGGIGGVARAALYRPLAEQDHETICAVMDEVKRFFQVIACIFGVYVLVLACSFHTIARSEVFDWFTTVLLVIAISISTFGQYFVGISNSILLQAAQKSYVTNMVNIAGIVVNTLMIMLLVAMKCDMVTVKLVSSLIFVARPAALWIYVKKRYRLKRVPRTEQIYLKQKWSGISQHIAFFLHSNTDVVILTCFTNLKIVAVYSVYNMVVANMQNMASSFITGMEAVFGDMLAKKEWKRLDRTFNTYETIISIVAVVLFSVTAVMIVPFVRIYTAGVTDVGYEMPLFSWLLTLSSLLYCLRMPYHSIIIAAGHFRQTQASAYGEAAINVGLSILLVSRFGLVGVAVGTLTATAFRMIYYVIYLSRTILQRRISLCVKRTLLNAAIYGLVIFTGLKVTATLAMPGYAMWGLGGVVVTAVALLITLGGNMLFERENCKLLLHFGKN